MIPVPVGPPIPRAKCWCGHDTGDHLRPFRFWAWLCRWAIGVGACRGRDHNGALCGCHEWRAR